MKEAIRISNSSESARRPIGAKKHSDTRKKYTEPENIPQKNQKKQGARSAGYAERLYNEWVMLCAGLCMCFFLLIVGGDGLRVFSESEGMSALTDRVKDAISENRDAAVFFGFDDILDETDTNDSKEPKPSEKDPEETEKAPSFVIGEGLGVKEYIEKYNKQHYKKSGDTPVSGIITSEYSFRKNPFFGTNANETEYEFHSGIDIAAPEGTEIAAYLDGVVEKCALSASYGYYVIIDHGDGLKTLYAHAQKLLCSEGERVCRGQSIALVGETGKATGPHLHFEVYENGETQDPKHYLSALYEKR